MAAKVWPCRASEKFTLMWNGSQIYKQGIPLTLREQLVTFEKPSNLIGKSLIFPTRRLGLSGNQAHIQHMQVMMQKWLD